MNMGNAVMLSIRPKWCELIASGRKTLEVRKTRPKLDPPFVCYIYQTRGAWLYECLRKWGMDELADRLILGSGKVIGAFVCDEIFEIPVGRVPTDYVLADMRMRGSEFHKYRGKGAVYCWHITNLAIYDEPIDLIRFCRPCDRQPGCYCETCRRSYGNKEHFISRPPQSWCYVEEL